MLTLIIYTMFGVYGKLRNPPMNPPAALNNVRQLFIMGKVDFDICF